MVLRLITLISAHNAHFTNHGRLAIVSTPGINFAKKESKLKPRTFEHLCCRVSGHHTPLIIAAVYQPGSQCISDQFFMELSSLLESLATFNSAILVVGDLNIHLEQPMDADNQKFENIIEAFKLRQLMTEEACWMSSYQRRKELRTM